MHRLFLFVAAVTTIALAACQYNPDAAQFPNVIDTLTVYALNGTPPDVPVGINFKAGAAVRLDQTFVFEVAFDLDTSNTVKIYPVRAVANGLISVLSVGLQKIAGNYDDYTIATTSGYTYDSVLVVPVGTTVAVNPLDPSTCTVYSPGTSYFGKLVVDSVNTVLRTLHVRMTADINCGYVTLTAGIPPK